MTVTRNKKKLRSTLAANIRARAERKRIGLNKLADFAGVSRSMMYDVLAGNQAPTVDWLDKVAGVLGAGAYALLRPTAGVER